MNKYYTTEWVDKANFDALEIKGLKDELNSRMGQIEHLSNKVKSLETNNESLGRRTSDVLALLAYIRPHTRFRDWNGSRGEYEHLLAQIDEALKRGARG